MTCYRQPATAKWLVVFALSICVLAFAHPLCAADGEPKTDSGEPAVQATPTDPPKQPSDPIDGSDANRVGTDLNPRAGRPSVDGHYVRLTNAEEAILNAIESNAWQFGWSGGEANDLDKHAKSYYDVTKVRVVRTNRFVLMSYDHKEGVIVARIEDHDIYGDWIQTNDTGRFRMRFAEDLTTATGWWCDDWQITALGAPIKRWAQFRVAGRGVAGN